MTDSERVASRFDIQGILESVAPIRMGHIHDSYISTWQTRLGLVRYLHQRINNKIFPNVKELMNNLRLITEHLRENSTPDKESMVLVSADNGQDVWVDSDGAHWRTFKYIENTEVFNHCPDTEHAFELGKAFSDFVVRLRDLPTSSLAVTIPNFFHAPTRVEQMKSSAASDKFGRFKTARKHFNFVLDRESYWTIISDLEDKNILPQRLIHGDPKINNVLFDPKSGKAVCVIDLDTCMKSSILYDFGDLVRTSGVDNLEDEPDTSLINVNLALFEALAEGYFEKLRSLMTKPEVHFLTKAPRLVTLTIGIRFLTDYLDGDTYFKVEHREHNLERAKAQFYLVKIMEDLEPEMERILTNI